MAGENAAPSGADVLLQCLVRHGVEVVFAYPGGAALPILQALTRVQSHMRTILPRHEQGGGFAASGYARTSGKVGVCVATSGPGATNLVTCLTDAHRHSVPLLAITGQVSSRVLGTDAFQEIPIVSLCRSVTKHHYLVTRAADLPRVMHEALHIATTGRPGPVLVDVPKNIQNEHFVPDYGARPTLPGYRPEVWEPQHAVHESAPGEDAAEMVLRHLCRLVRARGRWADTVLTTGFGPCRSWLAGAYRFPGPRHWIDSGSLGAIGFALPAALGVCAARPGGVSIAVDTPDSFISNVQELACAYCERLPVKVLLLGAAGPADVDFAEVARGFRAGASTVAAGDDLDPGLRAMLDAAGPYLLDVRLPVVAACGLANATC